MDPVARVQSILMGSPLHMDSLANLHSMEDITVKHSAKDWKVKAVKNFIL